MFFIFSFFLKHLFHISPAELILIGHINRIVARSTCIRTHSAVFHPAIKSVAPSSVEHAGGANRSCATCAISSATISGATSCSRSCTDPVTQLNMLGVVTSIGHFYRTRAMQIHLPGNYLDDEGMIIERATFPQIVF